LGGGLRYLTWFIAAVSVLFPVLALTVRGAANTCFFLIALCGILAIACRLRGAGLSFSEMCRNYWPLNLAMAGMFVAILLNQIATGHFSAREYDASLRLLLFPLVFWALLIVPAATDKYLEWGLSAGALFAFAKMFWLIQTGVDRLWIGGFISIIPYAEMAMMLGVFAAFSIGGDEDLSPWFAVPKILALLAGLSGAYLSQTRGAWLAIPAMLVISLLGWRMRQRQKLMVVSAVFAALGLMLCFGNIGQQRVVEAQSDIAAYMHGQNRDTSIGLRFQMWHASWLIFGQHPLFGAGREVVPKMLDGLAARNIISRDAARNGQGHTHNEILYNLASLGLFGLMSLLLTYFVPAWYFYRAGRETDRKIRCAGRMGLALCLGFFVFGLTDVQFLWGHCNTFYSMHAALFVACIVRRQAALRDARTHEIGNLPVSANNTFAS